ERTRIVDGWRLELARKKLRLPHRFELFLSDRVLSSIAERVDPSELVYVRAIEDELVRLDAQHVATACRELVTASVRRHEAQHGGSRTRSRLGRGPSHSVRYATDRSHAPRRGRTAARGTLGRSPARARPRTVARPLR